MSPPLTPTTIDSGGATLANDVRLARCTQPRPLRFYAELYVRHSPASVWALFSDLERWTTWSPICRGCRLRDDCKELQIGSVLDISFAVMGLRLMVPATVVQFDPPTSITWHGRKFGLEAIHSYRFLPDGQGTLLCNEETFFGAAFPQAVLLGAWYCRSQLSLKSLQGLKRQLDCACGIAK